MVAENGKPRTWQGVLSLFIPGLGQAVGGAFFRGLMVLFSVITIGGLTVFTAAQRPRFPDYGFSFRVFLQFMAETAALWIFVFALFVILRRYVLKTGFLQSIAPAVLVTIALLFFGLAAGGLMDMAVPADQTRMIYAFTSLFGAATVTAIWLWNIADAAQIRRGADLPSATPFILLVIVGILAIGTRATQIDLPKAIREYKDTQIVLSKIVWPWRAAFDYEASELRATAKIEAPCIDEAAAPPVNQPSSEGPWIVVTPTCGEVSLRDNKGKLTLGTLLTIRGGGFNPGQTARIQWENPIGNAFTPRGVGDTDIMVAEDGTFETQLYIPDVVIPEVAEGVQIHTLHVFQRGAAQFTGKLSREMILALQGMLETIMMGLMATFAGIVLSIPLSFLAARNLMHPIHTSTQGFVGGVIGLALGAWLGKVLAGLISNALGGLEQAPVTTALVHLVFILGLAVLAFRLLARLLDEVARRLPTAVGRSLSVLGFLVIGGALGYLLGLGYAYGILASPAITELPPRQPPVWA